MLHPSKTHLPEIWLYFSINLRSPKIPEKTTTLRLPSRTLRLPSRTLRLPSRTLRLPSGAAILRRRMLHHLLLRVRQGSLAEATVRQGTPAKAQAGREDFGRPASTKGHLVQVCSERYMVQGLHGQKRISGDAIVQGFSTVIRPVRPEGHLAVVLQH